MFDEHYQLKLTIKAGEINNNFTLKYYIQRLTLFIRNMKK